MIHSLSLTDADSPPAMYRRATLAIDESSTSMNVGITTAAAMIQGLTARRVIAVAAIEALLIEKGSCGNLGDPRRHNSSPDQSRSIKECRDSDRARPPI